MCVRGPRRGPLQTRFDLEKDADPDPFVRFRTWRLDGGLNDGLGSRPDGRSDVALPLTSPTRPVHIPGGPRDGFHTPSQSPEVTKGTRLYCGRNGEWGLKSMKVEARVNMVRAPHNRRLLSPESLGKRAQE